MKLRIRAKIASLLTGVRTSLAADAIIFNKPWSKVDVMLECHDNDRGLVKDGLAYSQILDGFQDELIVSGYKCLTLARPGSRVIRTAYGDVRSSASLLEELLGLFIRRLPGGRYFYNKYRIWLYKKILLYTESTLVVGIQPSRYLVVAGKSLGVPVVDLLHGYGVSKNHMTYGFNAIDRLPEELLCTDYVALDDYSRRAMEISLRKAKKSAKCWSYLSPVLKVNDVVNDHQASDFVKQYRKSFLITLQWGIERFERAYPHIDGELHPRILELITEGCEKGYGFVIKPHPVLLRNYDALVRLRKTCYALSNVWLEETLDLSSLLNMVCGNITIFSTTTREAAMMGKKTLLVSSDDKLFEGHDYLLQCEIESGMAVRVNNMRIEEILDTMDNFGKKSSTDILLYNEMLQPQYDRADLLVSDIIRSNEESNTKRLER